MSGSTLRVRSRRQPWSRAHDGAASSGNTTWSADSAASRSMCAVTTPPASCASVRARSRDRSVAFAEPLHEPGSPESQAGRRARPDTAPSPPTPSKMTTSNVSSRSARYVRQLLAIWSGDTRTDDEARRDVDASEVELACPGLVGRDVRAREDLDVHVAPGERKNQVDEGPPPLVRLGRRRHVGNGEADSAAGHRSPRARRRRVVGRTDARNLAQRPRAHVHGGRPHAGASSFPTGPVEVSDSRLPAAPSHDV